MNKDITELAIETYRISIITSFEATIFNAILNNETCVITINSDEIVIYDSYFEEINIIYKGDTIIKIKDHKIIFLDETIYYSKVEALKYIKELDNLIDN